MKNLILSAVIMAFVLISCNQKNKQEEATNTPMMENDSTMEMGNSTMKMEKDSENSATAQSSNTSINAIVANYLEIKNALTKDDSSGAADAGKALVETLAKIDMTKMSSDQMKTYMDIADDTKEHAEHIGDNPGKLDHQREHFVLLSKDINDLIATFGTNQKLYQDFCPMADDSKGAIWISETKEIKNPYFGSQMATCGSVKKEY